MVKKSTFSANFDDFWASDVDFWPFLVPKQAPGGYFFGVFLKTVILSKSCSRCGGSTVLEGQTLQKSIRRATPNGTGKKKRQKSLPAPSPDALFRPRARFLSILDSRPGPKIDYKTDPGKKSTGILAAETYVFAFSSLRRVPEGSRSASGGSGDPPGADFGRILQYFFADSVGIFSKIVGFRRDVAGIRTQPQ